MKSVHRSIINSLKGFGFQKIKSVHYRASDDFLFHVTIPHYQTGTVFHIDGCYIHNNTVSFNCVVTGYKAPCLNYENTYLCDLKDFNYYILVIFSDVFAGTGINFAHHIHD